MPFGYGCRSRIVKQVPAKPTIRTLPILQELVTPGPCHYEPPNLNAGKGFSNIRRPPAYSFGQVLRPNWPPAVSPNAPLVDISGTSKKGPHRIPGGLMMYKTELGTDKLKRPGPGAHEPKFYVQVKRPPAYSMRLAAKAPYRSLDTWTPPPNMYCPPIPKPKPPSFSFRYRTDIYYTSKTPGPGQHNPNHDYVRRSKPAFSFGPRFKPVRSTELYTPAPNAYCEKKFLISKPSVPAPSFGIRHSPYLGKRAVSMKPSDIETRIRQY
ncbi:hypothetical protein SFRURICE_015100 [Spodoptera frugiperda]|uniref:SFRICE_034241 n=1 Tax=Spodoptera frugiperda TaxID=7108 RepID=A0A2H1VJY4_SPOFR|nr:hypothetical protein SFRURICE_015100 [Spodoptera frugiperda]